MDKWIYLNVGGQQFLTSKSTLEKEPESMICRMVFGELPSLKDENGAILIDRSPKYFDAILNYLRMGEIQLDHDVNVEALIQEAKFYGIMSLVEKYEHNLVLLVSFSGFSGKCIMDKDNLSSIMEKFDTSKFVEVLSKSFAHLGNVRSVVIRDMDGSSRNPNGHEKYNNSVKAEIAFAKKEDVFKAQIWLESGLVIQGMKMNEYDPAKVYDFQLKKYL